MDPTTELFSFESTDQFQQNPGLVLPALTLVLTEKGVHSPAFYGQQIENPEIGFVFLNWDSREAHQAVIGSPSYNIIGQELQSCMRAGGKVNIYHTIFSPSIVALQQPVTEVLLLSLKSAENRSAVVDVLTKISGSGGKAHAFGQISEDENKYVLIGGWPSAEAYTEAAANPETKANTDILSSLANEEQRFLLKLSQHAS